MTTYSHSRLSCFESCPLKYKFQYIDRLPTPFEQSIEAFMGSRVHGALEKLYKDLLKCKENSLKDLLAYYGAEWEKHFTDSIACPNKGFKPKHFRKTGERCLTDYFNRFKPFDSDRTLGLEDRVVVRLDRGGKYVLQGFIDRVAQEGEGHYKVIDYKTSGSLPSQDCLDNDRQLAIYAIALRERFKDAKQIDLVWHFLAFDKTLTSERSPDQLSELKNELIELIQTIESTQEFKPCESRLCAWCGYQHECPKRKHLCKVEALPANRFLKEPGVKLVNEYAKVKAEIDGLTETLDDLKHAVYCFADKEKVSSIQGSNALLKIIETERLILPKEGTKEYAELERKLRKQGIWEELVALSQAKVKQAVEEKRVKGGIETTKMRQIRLNKLD